MNLSILRGIIFSLILLFSGAIITMSESTAEPKRWDVYSDTWVATDALGRTLPTHEQVGPPRADKFVGVFYFLWLGQHGLQGPYDVSKILAKNPEAIEQENHPAWGPMHTFHHWSEPLFGYYLSDDEYVYRKHAEMLSDADVDVIIFDVTNNSTYKKCYMTLCKVFSEFERDGGRPPKIAFLCPFGNPNKVVEELYKDLYGPGLYPNLWFKWDGKPLIMADPLHCSVEMRSFFTFRKPVASYFTGPSGPDQWGWLEVFPQHVFRNGLGEPEQMVVGVAQNAVDGRLGSMSEKNAEGRSFCGGKTSDQKDAVLHGLNFAEQAKRALEVDPKFVFITGWNEWIAMRFNEFAGVREPVMLVDQFDQEHSRDIEPMKGGHGDNYYYQMIDFVRRYKGVRLQPPATAPKTMKIDGDFSKWADVGPEFRHHAGSTQHRNHPGWGQAGQYVNTTGRNDIVLSRVSRDDDFLYFYVQTKAPISPRTDPHWMTLFINSDRKPDTGWEGYDFVVNRKAPSEDALYVEKCVEGWKWEHVAKVSYRIVGCEMELAIPRKALHLDSFRPLDMEFKWVDNIQKDGDIMEFTVSGDSAPSGRFNYRYYEGS